jgi:hypothetical protein
MISFAYLNAVSFILRFLIGAAKNVKQNVREFFTNVSLPQERRVFIGNLVHSLLFSDHFVLWFHDIAWKVTWILC